MREAMTEIAIDLDEGADMVIVKPALAYLDVVAPPASVSMCRSPPTTFRGSTR